MSSYMRWLNDFVFGLKSKKSMKWKTKVQVQPVIQPPPAKEVFILPIPKGLLEGPPVRVVRTPPTIIVTAEPPDDKGK